MMKLGSGRPARWANDIALYAQLPLDEKIAGIGIGVRSTSDDDEVGGHSDWLRVLWDTGIIGFVLFAWLQILILRAILRMRGSERHIFLALFAAVNVMMLVSNSYTLRIQVGQLYYMILAFIEIPRRHLENDDAEMRTTTTVA
jgi:O-antigen ligase